jgi:hypothetical protein
VWFGGPPTEHAAQGRMPVPLQEHGRREPHHSTYSGPRPSLAFGGPADVAVLSFGGGVAPRDIIERSVRSAFDCGMPSSPSPRAPISLMFE